MKGRNWDGAGFKLRKIEKPTKERIIITHTHTPNNFDNSPPNCKYFLEYIDQRCESNQKGAGK